MSEQYDQNIGKFVEVAARYCALAESVSGDLKDDLANTRRLLAELHLALISLPETDFDESHETEPVSPEAWKRIQQRFACLPVDGYWDVFDPLKEEEPVFNLLSDDLADIYRDLKEPFQLYEKGHIEEAVWEWRFHFQIHWGRHLVGAQRAIHSYLSSTESEIR